MKIDDFIEKLEKIDIKITSHQLEQLEKYYELLILWNKKMNLTGITEKEEVYLKHFYDSATLNKGVDLTKFTTLCDIGTGAGFPGIVLKILFPNLSITLIDSLGKRISFLKEVKAKLGLKDIEIIEIRAEEYAKKVREKYDIVTARAVANIHILMEYSIPLLKKGGYFIPMKASNKEELENINQIENVLKVRHLNTVEFYLPYEQGKRMLPIFQKIEKTPLKYPRKYSEIKKSPL